MIRAAVGSCMVSTLLADSTFFHTVRYISCALIIRIMNTEISVVIPAFHSEKSLPILIKRLNDVLISLGGIYEIIIIDDGSTDNTWKVLKAQKNSYKKLKIVRLLRNSGQHNAILCGLGMSQGNIVITMDDDLQHLPEDIPKLIKGINDGYDLVIGAYEKKKHSVARNMGGKVADNILRHIFGLPDSFQLTSFRAVRKAVVDKAVGIDGTCPYITYMLLSHSAKYKNVLVSHDSRQFGDSNYDLKRSLGLIFDLLLSHYSYLLHVLMLLCFSACFFSIFTGAYIVWVDAHEGSVQEWIVMAAAISFIAALPLIVLAINGAYLSKVAQRISRSQGFYIGEIH